MSAQFIWQSGITWQTISLVACVNFIPDAVENCERASQAEAENPGEIPHETNLLITGVGATDVFKGDASA